ncbi:MAG: Fe-S-containing hydro-lyase [candidate division Zixibacteria bacterium]|nr:Fe-S-containing hydro-lyase [candidate division Zixibacteria bacterium]
MSEDTKKITTPLTDDVVQSLKAGDRVFITGEIYTARDAAHKRMVDLINEGKAKELPFNPTGQLIYFVGPAPAKPGKPIGSAGPTTSYRMNSYTPTMIENGLKGMIGKGEMGPEVVAQMKDKKAVYMVAIGGAAALVARSIKKAEIIAYEDLGAEAVRRLEVEDFPAIVAQDCHGENMYIKGIEQYKR